MVHEKNAKLKIPYSISKFQQIEDDLTQIVEGFREVRRKMSQHGLNELSLKAGTFLFDLERMRPMVADFHSEVTKLAIQKSVKITRAKYKKERRGR